MLGSTMLSPASAQDSPIDMLKFLPGLETAYSRAYRSADDLPLKQTATPDATAAPDATSSLTVTVLEFESPDDVTTAFSVALNDEIAGQLMGNPDIEFSVSEQVDGLGDQGHLYLSDEDMGHAHPISGLLAVQDGNLGFLIQAEGDDETIQDRMTAVAEFMIDAEPGDGPVVVDDVGAASGGTFDVMPTTGDEDALGALFPTYDYNLLVSTHPLEPSGTPAA